MYLNYKAIINSLTEEDIIKVCTALGHGEYTRGSHDSLCFNTCLCHGGDSPNKLVYYPHDADGNGTGRFRCYTCGDTYGIIELIIRAHRQQGKTLTWYKALYFLAKITNKLIESNPEDIKTKTVNTDLTWMNRIKNLKNKRVHAVPNLKTVNENNLELFWYDPDPLQPWLNDGISKEALSRYEIGWYGLTNQITIPVRDRNENLVGIRCRNLNPEDVAVAKYDNMYINGQKLRYSTGSTLYGIWVTQDKIKQNKKVMLVEAEKSCLLAYTYFKDNSYVVATCGSAITLTQQKILLNDLKVSKIIYAPDRDYEEADSYEAEVWLNKQIKKLAPFVPYCQVFLVADSKNRIGYKDSPLDCGKDIFLELYEEKIEITMEDVKRVKEEMLK